MIEINDTNYYGNSTVGFDADDPAPTLILYCEFCLRDLEFYGDDSGTLIDGVFTLGSEDIINCSCGANYGEGDRMEVVPEEAQLSRSVFARNPVTVAYHEAQRELAATHGWPALVDGVALIDSRDDAPDLIAELRGQLADCLVALGGLLALINQIDDYAEHPAVIAARKAMT